MTNIANIYLGTHQKMENHLWYLSDKMIGFSCFDSEVSVSMKRKIIKALYYTTSKGPNRIILRASRAENYYLADFVTPNTLDFFKKFNICIDFLKVDPKSWGSRVDYTEGLTIVKSIMTMQNVE